MGITESDRYLPPLALAYKNQPKAQRATRVQIRGQLGAPQPIGRPQQPAAPAAPVDGLEQAMRILRRRMMQDDDAGE